MPIQLIGPTYNLESRTADVQRSINLYPVKLESGASQFVWALRDMPGLVSWADLGGTYRGHAEVNGRLFVVIGTSLLEVSSTGSTTNRGTIGGTGRVQLAANTTQLGVATSGTLYVLTLASNVLTNVAWQGTNLVQYFDQFALYIQANTQQFGWSAVGDFSAFDALDFASAEGAPDNLVSILVSHREALLFGTKTVERWIDVGGDQQFARDSTVFIEHGCAAALSPCQVANTVIWLGNDATGAAAVFQMNAGQPQRVSTRAIEERLQGQDLSEASAFTHTWQGSPFYVLNVPGLNTTLAYDVGTGQWHERGDFVNGDFIKHRAVAYVRAFGLDLVFDETGKVYKLDSTVSNNAGDPLVRDRITPNNIGPDHGLVRYPSLEIGCDKGNGGSILMRYSNDGGAEWSSWLIASLGALGERRTRVKWNRCGMALDRVWHIRVTDDVPFNPVWAV